MASTDRPYTMIHSHVPPKKTLLLLPLPSPAPPPPLPPPQPLSSRATRGFRTRSLERARERREGLRRNAGLEKKNEKEKKRKQEFLTDDQRGASRAYALVARAIRRGGLEIIGNRLTRVNSECTSATIARGHRTIATFALYLLFLLPPVDVFDNNNDNNNVIFYYHCHSPIREAGVRRAFHGFFEPTHPPSPHPCQCSAPTPL